MSVENLVKINLTVVALNDLRLWLEGADNALDMFCIVFRDFGYLVEKDDVAELNLLYYEALKVFLANLLGCQFVARLELAFKTQGIDHSDYAVENRHAVAGEIGSNGGHRADCLGDGFWLADAACLDHNIVEILMHEVGELLHEISFEGAADATVLESHEAVVATADHTTLGDEVSVDVHLADVVDDNSEFYAFLIVENLVKQSGLSASEIAGEQEDWCGFRSHCGKNEK